MNSHLRDKLKRDFSAIWPKNEDPSNNLMSFSPDCGDGWYELIRSTLEDVVRIASTAGFLDRISLFQIKQKFGLLRIYVAAPPDVDLVDEKERNALADVYARLDEVGKASAKICEKCGSDPDRPGKMHIRANWLRTLCEPCAALDGYVRYVNAYGKEPT